MTGTEVFGSAYVLERHEIPALARKPVVRSLLQVQIGMHGEFYPVTMTAEDSVEYDFLRPAQSIKWFRDRELAEAFFKKVKDPEAKVSWDDELVAEEARLIAGQERGKHFGCEFPSGHIPPKPKKNARRS